MHDRALTQCGHVYERLTIAPQVHMMQSKQAAHQPIQECDPNGFMCDRRHTEYLA